VGKNIAGLGGIIGKSQTNILNDDNLNLASGVNKLSNDPTKRFATHNHIQNDPGYNNQIQSSGGIQKHQPQSGFSNAARNNLQIHRITSQQDHKA
jgi:hypothetical protein